MYNINVKRFFVIIECVHMNEKTGTGVSYEKEKVKESQSRSVTPPLDIHFGCRVGSVTVLDMLSSLESRVEVLTKHVEELRQEVAIYKTALSARVMATHEAPRVEVPKPHKFNGQRDANELDNFLWHMERYFEAITLTDEATKVRTATLYLTNNATLWCRRRFMEIQRGTCTIDTWADFKRKIKKQFYPENAGYIARRKIRHLKHTGSVRDYVKEFSSLMLEAPDMNENELLFNFMENLQGWAEQELRKRGVQDLSTAMAVA